MTEQKFPTEQEIAKLKELEAKATRPEWATYVNLQGRTLLMIPFANDVLTAAGKLEERGCMELAALSRNLLPSLIKEREEMQEREAVLGERLDQAHNIIDAQRERIRWLEGALRGIVERFDQEDTGKGFPERGGQIAWAMASDARAALGAPLEEVKKGG